jgi:hypothetical protein
MKARAKLITGATGTRIYDKWQGYSVEDCLCRYCLYFIRERKGEVICWKDPCPYRKIIAEALRAGRIKAAPFGKGGPQ